MTYTPMRTLLRPGWFLANVRKSGHRGEPNFFVARAFGYPEEHPRKVSN
jgi:hypothetical protein